MKAETLKKSILQYAMQGKLVAQDPNDEPASELLKRIKAEKEQLIKDGKINIGDNDLLKAHLLNAAVKMNNERGRGRIVKITPTAHIDAMAATLDALTVRAKFYNEIGEQLKNGTL